MASKLKIYTHALQKADRDAANKLENLFKKETYSIKKMKVVLPSFLRNK